MTTDEGRSTAVADPPRVGRGDGALLFAMRTARMFGYGMFAVILGLYLSELGFGARRIGLLVTLTLAGDTVISLLLTSAADRFGRRRTLLAGACLMAGAGALFATTSEYWLLVVAATVGVISPSGGEVGPFLAVEQAALTETAASGGVTRLFAWYNLTGSAATALGALVSGAVVQSMKASGIPAVTSYRAVVAAYAGIGLLLALLAWRLSPAVEAAPRTGEAPPSLLKLGLHRSRSVVLRLSALFTLDAFAGGLVVQSLVAYWFHLRFGLDAGVIGAIFFGANILAGVSALAAARIARRFGLLNTMVFTHLPSNVLLILVPLMPTLPLTLLVFLLRFSISQMDVPTRQAYLMAAVVPEERSAAGGVANVARTVGASLSPVLAGLFLASATYLGAIFVLSGGLKVLYDLLLLRSFRSASVGER